MIKQLFANGNSSETKNALDPVVLMLCTAVAESRHIRRHILIETGHRKLSNLPVCSLFTVIQPQSCSTPKYVLSLPRSQRCSTHSGFLLSYHLCHLQWPYLQHCAIYKTTGVDQSSMSISIREGATLSLANRPPRPNVTASKQVPPAPGTF